MNSVNEYSFPFRKENFIIAISDPRAHFGHFKDAIDFTLPGGSEVLAALDGEVIEVKVDSKEGGPDSKYDDLKYLNYITLKHDNEEYSQYGHLNYKGAFVKEGDFVKQGQKIAITGRSGLTTCPHLHFCVFKLVKTKEGWESLRVRFKEELEVYKDPSKIPDKLLNKLKSMEYQT